MITEDRISFETAKLLKEKGFDEYCGYYSSDGEYWGYCVCNHKGKDYISAPTLQMTMKWLREVHGKFISVVPGTIFGRFDVFVYYDNYTKLRIIERNKDNYEEAVETAIKYCLENLI